MPVQDTEPRVSLRINGQRLTTGAAGTFDHVSPVTGQRDATIPMAGPRDVDAAVEAAAEAFTSWRRTQPAVRRGLLNRLADLIEQHEEDFVRLGVLDNGTPKTVVASFIAGTTEWIRYYAGWAGKVGGDLTAEPQQNGELAFTVAEPYGVIAVITTWNSPLISLAMKIAPAIAAANTVVAKPSELAPFTGDLFMDLVEQAGFPPGVINLIVGDGAAGARLVEHESVGMVTFTGGVVTAQKILKSCAVSIKPVVLELGGKSANILLEDADLATACTHATLMSVVALSGQGCALPTRLLVHESMHDKVVAQVKAVAESITSGDPMDERTASGPLINQAAVDRVLGMIERAKEDGAVLVTGGKRLQGELANGFFIEPTVFTNVDPRSELAQTEVFGPVLAISTYKDDEEAVAIANSTMYGLSSYVQTSNINRALWFASELVAGEVLINGAGNVPPHRPFGGVGRSGLGKEGGRHGIEEFLRIKSVAIGMGSETLF